MKHSLVFAAEKWSNLISVSRAANVINVIITNTHWHWLLELQKVLLHCIYTVLPLLTHSIPASSFNKINYCGCPLTDGGNLIIEILSEHVQHVSRKGCDPHQGVPYYTLQTHLHSTPVGGRSKGSPLSIRSLIKSAIYSIVASTVIGFLCFDWSSRSNDAPAVILLLCLSNGDGFLHHSLPTDGHLGSHWFIQNLSDTILESSLFFGCRPRLIAL